LYISTDRNKSTVREDEVVTARNKQYRAFIKGSVLQYFIIRIKVLDRAVCFAVRFRTHSTGLNIETMRSK